MARATMGLCSFKTSLFFFGGEGEQRKPNWKHYQKLIKNAKTRKRRSGKNTAKAQQTLGSPDSRAKVARASASEFSSRGRHVHAGCTGERVTGALRRYLLVLAKACSSTHRHWLIAVCSGLLRIPPLFNPSASISLVSTQYRIRSPVPPSNSRARWTDGSKEHTHGDGETWASLGTTFRAQPSTSPRAVERVEGDTVGSSLP